MIFYKSDKTAAIIAIGALTYIACVFFSIDGSKGTKHHKPASTVTTEQNSPAMQKLAK